jgi:hypothetical protein
MPIPAAPCTFWLGVSNTAAQVSSTSYPIPRGCRIVGSVAFSFGLASTVTHESGAATDGFPVQANTPTTIDPKFCNDLSRLYVIAGGSGNLWFYLLPA